MATSADKKNEARAKREAAQAQAAAAAKRTRMLQYLAGAVFAAIVIVVLVVVITGGKETGGGASEGGDAQVEGVAETKALLKDIPVNGLTLGDPKAPVTILEFVDVQCPFCKDHQLDQTPKLINDLVRTGKARIALKPIALSFMGEDSQAGRVVAVRLSEKDLAWPFLNLFYFNQGQEQTGYVTDEFLQKLVVAAGGTKEDASPREPSPEEAKKLAEIDALQEPLNVTGTPSFAIGKTGDDLTTYKPFEATSADVADDLIKAVEDLGLGSAKSGT